MDREFEKHFVKGLSKSIKNQFLNMGDSKLDKLFAILDRAQDLRTIYNVSEEDNNRNTTYP